MGLLYDATQAALEQPGVTVDDCSYKDRRGADARTHHHFSMFAP